MTNQLEFVTGNSRKVGEATLAFGSFDITIKQVRLDIDEIQSHDPVQISIRKATEAYRQLNKPVVINDTFWSIPALNGFPGGYMRDVAEWFSAEDFINLVRDKADKTIIMTECVVYIDSDQQKVITKEYLGEITLIPKGIGNSIEQVAVFNSHTLAEHHDLGQFSHKPEDYIWHDFATWYQSAHQ